MSGITTLYLVRHCEAEGNWRRTFQGHTDSEVSDKGRRQLEKLAQRFAPIHLDAVYSSPLKRAVATAQAIDRAAGLPIQLEPDVIEINGGRFEGVPFADLPRLFPVEQEAWERHPEAFVAPGGESMAQVYARMQAAIARIVAAHPGETVAVASHGCAIRNYQCYACGWDLSRLNELGWSDNTAVSKFEFEEGDPHPRILYLSDASHLGEGDSTLATQDWWKSAPQPGLPEALRPKQEAVQR